MLHAVFEGYEFLLLASSKSGLAWLYMTMLPFLRQYYTRYYRVIIIIYTNIIGIIQGNTILKSIQNNLTCITCYFSCYS